jgi:hypothetical protein
MTLVGKTVVVARGRKVPKGTTGVVIWEGAGFDPHAHTRNWRYSYSPPAPTRVGVKDAAGTVHWTASKNCDVTEAPVVAAEAPAPVVAAPAKFSKGTEVITEVGVGKIFWTGADKRNPGKNRVGVKVYGETVWASEDEVTLAA